MTAATFDGATLRLQVVNRFANSPRQSAGALRWDIGALWRDVRNGLAELANGNTAIDSVGVDTWGVDYGLFDRDGTLIDDPVCYRDDRGLRAMSKATNIIGAQRIYQATGVQILSINTLYGLFADMLEQPTRLRRAHTLQMMPDVFHRMLSGTTVSEYTAVSTSGAYDMQNNRWATELLDALGIPTGLLPVVVPPGTDVGPLLPGLAEGRLSRARVIVPPGHDTASAVVAVPYTDSGALFISSGTWSLAGVEVTSAIVTDSSRTANMTNEGGYGGSIRLLRNVMGLWILQECRRQWSREGVDVSYPELARLADVATGLVSLINPDDPVFLSPGDMPRRIRDYCARTGQQVPQSIGEVSRCVVDSLAVGYRLVVDDIELVTGRRPPSVSVVGGGANHSGLAQLTANATGLPVYCGPVEATALGNAAVQFVSLGELSGPQEIREVVAASSEIISYQPRPDDRWDLATERLRALRDPPPSGSEPAGPRMSQASSR